MSDKGGATPAAGWFPDPGGSGQLRWWDGQQWTEHTHAQPPGWGRTDPSPAVAEERKIAKWAGYAIIGYAFLTAIGGALLFRVFSGFREIMSQAIANPEAPPALPDPAAGPFAFPGMDAGSMAGLQLLNAVQLALGILILLWVYRSATAAAQLGIPARHAPGWAIGSWFIPVINLWWPWQCLQDLFPAEHPMRRRLTLFWLMYLFGALVSVTALVAWMFGVDQAIWIGAAGYLSTAGALLAGRTIADEALSAHEALLAGGGAGMSARGS